MPLFPSTIPSLPSFPSFPSISSMRQLLDPEPQLFYPAPKSPARHQRRDSTSSNRSSHSIAYNESNSGGIVSGSPVRRAPPVGLRSGLALGRSERASRSAVDLTGWSTVDNPLTELGRRNSVSTPFSGGEEQRDEVRMGRNMQIGGGTELRIGSATTSSSSSPSKMNHHRRSQSALPSPGYNHPSTSSAPRGRLTEFSRSSLASSSAISLPTLAEGDAEHLNPTSPATPVGYGQTRLYRRPSSRATIIIPSSPSSPGSSIVGSLPSPLGLSYSLSSQSSSSSCGSGESDYFGPDATMKLAQQPDEDETPRPNRRAVFLTLSPPALGTHSSVPPPQRVARLRPPPSLGSCQPGGARGTGHGHRLRTQSSGGTGVPFSKSIPVGSIGTTASISDVAVMATWSFPPSPERLTPRPSTTLDSLDRPNSVVARIGEPSGRLRERLRTLSMLDTSPTQSDFPDSISSDNLITPVSQISDDELHQVPSSTSRQSFQFPPPSLARTTSSTSHINLRHQLHHRYTHSSPHTLPPPRPPTQRDSPASRGKLVFPGSSPSRSSSESFARNPSPSISGHRRTTTPSRLRSPQLLSLPLASEGAIARHPLARTRSAIEAPSDIEAGRKKGGQGWWRLRRNSVSGEISPRKGETKEGKRSDGEVEIILNDDDDVLGSAAEGRRERGMSPENETFIDFDDI